MDKDATTPKRRTGEENKEIKEKNEEVNET